MPLTPEEKNEYDHKVIYDDLLRRIKSAGSRITSLDGRVEEYGSTVSEFSVNLENLGQTVSGHTGDLEELSGEVSNLSDDVESLNTKVDNLDQSLDGIDVTSSIQFGNGDVLTSSENRITVPLGVGMTWRNNSLDTAVRVFTDQATADENAVDGDVLVLATADGASTTTLPSASGSYVYTGTGITGSNETFLITNRKIGAYTLQCAVNISDWSYQYTRVLDSSGNPNNPNLGWALSYAKWA